MVHAFEVRECKLLGSSAFIAGNPGFPRHANRRSWRTPRSELRFNAAWPKKPSAPARPSSAGCLKASRKASIKAGGTEDCTP